MPDSIGKEFMRLTRHEHMPQSAQNLKLPQPPLELPCPEGAQLIPLPDPHHLAITGIDLLTAINQRATIRKYADQALTLDELSYLLWCTQGVKEFTKRPVTLRTVPSAGARHAFETYLLVNRVESLAPGLYRFIAGQHGLIAVDLSADINERITAATGDQSQVRASAVTFFWAAVLERMQWRYPERGYRYLFLDAGHVCQNLYLAAEAIECGVCAIAAYDDVALNAVIGLDGENQFVAYAGSLGKRAV